MSILRIEVIKATKYEKQTNWASEPTDTGFTKKSNDIVTGVIALSDNIMDI